MTATININHPLLLLISPILLTLGLWMLFPKCGVNRLKALIPYYRKYKLAQAADMEDAGIILMLASIATNFLPVVYGVVEKYQGNNWFDIALLGIVFALLSVVLIYEIRIYIRVCRMFNKKTIWVVVWITLPFIPAILWGFDKKVKSVFDVETAAPVSGEEVEEIAEGLSINLESRSTREFFVKKYLLRDIHMNIKPGKMVLLLGGSGAGKTTLVNAIIGYEPAKAKVLLNGEDVYKEYDKMKYEIALVPQQDLMRYDDTVLRTLSDAAILRMPEEIGIRERNARVKEVLEMFGLGPSKSNEVEKLSGGQKKRLSIAMEYISDPYLFVLDEPDSGLDGVLARDLMTRLRAIADQGKIVIVITHSPDRVVDLFDDVIVLAKDANKTGRLVFYGPIDEAREFFGTDRMEDVVKMINRKNEGGEGRADELIEKFMEVSRAEE